MAILRCWLMNIAKFTIQTPKCGAVVGAREWSMVVKGSSVVSRDEFGHKLLLNHNHSTSKHTCVAALVTTVVRAGYWCVAMRLPHPSCTEYFAEWDSHIDQPLLVGVIYSTFKCFFAAYQQLNPHDELQSAIMFPTFSYHDHYEFLCHII